MSHYVQADFSAEYFRVEETYKQLIKRLESYNLTQQQKEELFKRFGVDELRDWFESRKERQRISEMEYRKSIRQINRLNELLNGIEAYIFENFNLEVDNYNKQVENLLSFHLEKNQDVLKNVLDKINDELLKNYILSVYRENPSLNEEQLLETAKERMQQSKKYKRQQILENIQKIKNKRKEMIDLEEKSSHEIIAEINNEQATGEIEKNVRNRVLASVIKIIKRQGFIVKRENVVDKGDHAVINTIKPNGEHVRFEVYHDGRFLYKFDQYEGMACEKDIEKFEEEFENIYGIKLENKKTLWSNPDRIQKQHHNRLNNKKIGD